MGLGDEIMAMGETQTGILTEIRKMEDDSIIYIVANEAEDREFGFSPLGIEIMYPETADEQN